MEQFPCAHVSEHAAKFCMYKVCGESQIRENRKSEHLAL